MLQAANTGLFNPLVPNAHNRECQNLWHFLCKLSSYKAGRVIYFLHPRHKWVNWHIFALLVCEAGRAGHFRCFWIFSIKKNDFLNFLSS